MFSPNENVCKKHKVSKAALAACFGFTPNMLTAKFITPEIVTPDSDGQFNIGDIIKIANETVRVLEADFYQEENLSSKDEAIIKRDLAVASRQESDAELSQVQLHRERGQLIPTTVVAKFFSDAMATLRSRLLKLPANLSLEIDGNEDEQRKFAVFADNEVRRELIEASEVVGKIVEKIIEQETEAKKGV